MTNGRARITGRVQKRLVNPGSKSERIVVQIEGPDGRWLELRNASEPAFQHTELFPLDGHSVTVVGREQDQYFFFDELKAVEEE